MAAGRALKGLASRRRRADEEGEEDDGPAMAENSQSEGSVLSDLEDDDESSIGAGTVDDVLQQEDSRSEVTGEEDPTAGNARRGKKHSGRKKLAESTAGSSALAHSQAGVFKATEDTQAMIHGLNIGDQTAEDAIDFESVSRRGSVAPPPATQSVNGHREPVGQRPRNVHEDYRRKRETDPSFIPNRGNFFMHDTRSKHGQGSLPGRGAWGGRGRGRGGANVVSGPHTQSMPLARTEQAAEQPWKHDLHETINEESARPSGAHHARDEINRFASKYNGPNHPGKQQILSFSSTKLVGKVQIRVSLSGMKAPIAFPEVPWKHYIRLPDHRPPLRRDKPVRVSLPGHPQRYIFPAAERSFIFIPRQMRPNQQGFGRNAYPRSAGGYGYSSRRTSMYGGSMYATSVAASRRSSFASVSRDNAFSPVGCYGGMPPSRPNIRMTHGQQPPFMTPSPMGHMSGHHTPNGMQIHTFPLPQQPTYQGIPTTTVHQPRPQKTISVTGIESPAALQQAPGTQDAQPFQNQLPPHMNEQMGFGQPSSSMYSPREHFQYPQPPQSATPLSRIPEQTINAPSFQPPVMAYGAGPYYPPYPPPQQQYFYPQGPTGYPPMPMYAPQQNYMNPPPALALPSQGPPQAPPSRPAEADSQQSAQAPSGMVAHESNGMVFYLPASEAPQQSQGERYQPAESFVPSYAMPGLPPPTPAPETSYYYPPQVPQQAGYYSGMQ